MPQKVKTSCFIFSEFINIVLGYILSLKLELLLFYGKSTKDSALLIFYIDNIIRAFKIYQEQYILLHNHFFLRIVWSELKLILSKLKIRMTKIFALKKEHKIGRKIKLKQDIIEKILASLVPENKTAIKAFFGTI